MNSIPGHHVPEDYSSFGPTTFSSFNDAKAALREVDSTPEQAVQNHFHRLTQLLMTISECLDSPTGSSEGTAHYELHKMVSLYPHSDWRVVCHLGGLDLLLSRILTDVRIARDKIDTLKHFLDCDLKVQRQKN